MGFRSDDELLLKIKAEKTAWLGKMGDTSKLLRF